MLPTAVETGESADGFDQRTHHGSPAVVVSAGVKAVVAAVSGLFLTCSFGLLIWAITPSSGTGPDALLRAGVTAFGAANGMTVKIGSAALTLPPLMIAVVAIALLTTVSGRGRVVARGRRQELISGVTAAMVYAGVVTAAGVVLGSPGALRADQWWRPVLLAAIVIGCTTVVRGDGWRPYLTDRLPTWVPVSIRLGAVGIATLLGGGAVTLAIGLARSIGDSTAVQTSAAPGAAGGFGMALLAIAYLPNAVIAGAGYSTGVGFSIGGGTYSLFGSSPVELPALSLLTAAPHGHTLAKPALLLLLFPLLAAVLIGRAAIRRLDSRNDRLLAVAGAALFAAVVMALTAGWASGGVTGGEWSSSGVPAALFGLVIAVGLGAVGAAVAGVAPVPAVATDIDIESSESGISAADVGDLTAVSDDQDDPAEAIDEEPAELVDDETVAALDKEALDDDPAEAIDDGPAEAVDDETNVAVDDETDDTGAADGATVRDALQREEDLIAQADEETDGDLIERLARPAPPRQVG